MRPRYTADAMGVVYLLCFERALGNPDNPRAMARHYLGWCLDLSERVGMHENGRGAAITRAAVARGIGFVVARTWTGTPALEQRLKAKKSSACLCPICCRARGRRPLPAPIDAIQLELPLFPADDFPEPPRLRMDWLEIKIGRDWRANRPALALAGHLDDDLL